MTLLDIYFLKEQNICYQVFNSSKRYFSPFRVNDVWKESWLNGTAMSVFSYCVIEAVKGGL